MNQIDTSQISDPNVQQPFTGPSLTFLQNATKEVVAATINSLIDANGYSYTLNTPYVLYGCVKTLISGSNYSFTSGYIYYNGEIYLLNTISSVSLPTSAIATITVSNDSTADPVYFSDQLPRNVHNHRTLVIADGAPVTNGATQFNFSSCVFFNATIGTINSEINSINSSISTINSEINVINGGWSDLTLTSGNFTVDIGSGSVSSVSGDFFYHQNGSTMSFVLNATFSISGDVTAVAINLSSVFHAAYPGPGYAYNQLALDNGSTNIVVGTITSGSGVILVKLLSSTFASGSHNVVFTGTIEFF